MISVLLWIKIAIRPLDLTHRLIVTLWRRMSHAVSYMVVLLQEGNYTWQPLPAFMTSNITASDGTPAKSMVVAPRIDVPYRHYLSAVNNNCSVIDSIHLADINKCAQTSPYGYGGTEGGHGSACCYNTTGQVRRFAIFKGALLLLSRHQYILLMYLCMGFPCRSSRQPANLSRLLLALPPFAACCCVWVGRHPGHAQSLIQ